jgi:predicted phosphate transport protein (TIGR00153 family)
VPRWNPTVAQRDNLLRLFAEGAANAARAAQHLETMVKAWPARRQLQRDIRNFEHDGDRITHDVVSQLERSFILPFDRQDGHQLAVAIDDVLDYIDEAAEHMVIYKVGTPLEQVVTLATLIRECTGELVAETRSLGQPRRLGTGTRRIDQLEHEADRTLRSALASLFDREVDPLVVLRWNDILARLENAIDSCNQAARVLETIRIKDGI